MNLLKKRFFSMKKQLAAGAAVALLGFSGAVSAAGQVAIVINDTVIEEGEEVGITLVLNGDGHYDVYAAVTGGALGSDIHVFGPGGVPILWTPDQNVPKLLDDVDLGSLAVKDKIIQLVPKIEIPLGSGLEGEYTFYGALSTPGQMDFPILDAVPIKVR
ncbi:MAG: hypothetical protein GY862_24440 [Gammaproteobacteria bacterium]|nr:hypothetical protein [Gammaproteobacteria bacterium]